MRIALLADVHANLEALQACLEHARAQGASRLAFLGDLVGYGPDPVEVLDRVAALVADGALAVLGNHDAAALAGQAESMNEAAWRALSWTASRLGDAQRRFLSALPLVARVGDALLVHASAAAPAEWEYVQDPIAAGRSLAAAGDARYVLCGHVHEPVLYYTGAAGGLVAFRPVSGVAVPVPPRRRWVAVAGAVGQPRDGSAAASYAILDDERATLTFFRVPYDWRATVARMRAAGLPESLATRLATGR